MSWPFWPVFLRGILYVTTIDQLIWIKGFQLVYPNTGGPHKNLILGPILMGGLRSTHVKKEHLVAGRTSLSLARKGASLRDFPGFLRET